ncbi:rhomboid family intramembrane serine protease [Pseudofulvibacter geojedonensis]|uniref:Rhomboid family intramembrane serine protease n=2 Tax=Pseudofulvibacter geojedonensis TaxID=1123758 RepID=A0ABW3I4U0_9FLAO
MKRFYDIINIIFYPVLFILLMWTVFLVEINFGNDFTKFGVYPRKLSGLIGVVASPFIHSDLKHITNNSITFFVLMLAIRVFYKKNFLRVFWIGLLLSGSLTWLIGRNSYHIGMSGVIYMLASFIMAKGFFSKNYHLIALTLCLVFLYGGMIWYVLPIVDGVSWEGHLAGMVAGILLSFFFKNEILVQAIKRPALTPNQELFLEHFDENGKFVANLPFLDEDGNLILDEE